MKENARLQNEISQLSSTAVEEKTAQIVDLETTINRMKKQYQEQDDKHRFVDQTMLLGISSHST